MKSRDLITDTEKNIWEKSIRFYYAQHWRPHECDPPPTTVLFIALMWLPIPRGWLKIRLDLTEQKEQNSH